MTRTENRFEETDIVYRAIEEKGELTIDKMRITKILAADPKHKQPVVAAEAKLEGYDNIVYVYLKDLGKSPGDAVLLYCARLVDELEKAGTMLGKARKKYVSIMKNAGIISEV